MNGNEIDMRMFAQRAGASVSYPAGSIVFKKDDPGSCMYIVQSGVIEMLIGDTVVETCGPNEAIGFMSMVDGAARSSTARVKETCELSLIDQRKFRFMVDEVPNFALYIMGRDGAAHPRHESGDVTIHVWHIAGRLCQESIPHRPLMPPAAGGAKNAEILLPDAQERADLALDAAVDLASRGWAYEDEVFHNRLHRRN